MDVAFFVFVFGVFSDRFLFLEEKKRGGKTARPAEVIKAPFPSNSDILGPPLPPPPFNSVTWSLLPPPSNKKSSRPPVGSTYVVIRPYSR